MTVYFAAALMLFMHLGFCVRVFCVGFVVVFFLNSYYTSFWFSCSSSLKDSY